MSGTVSLPLVWLFPLYVCFLCMCAHCCKYKNNFLNICLAWNLHSDRSTASMMPHAVCFTRWTWLHFITPHLSSIMISWSGTRCLYSASVISQLVLCSSLLLAFPLCYFNTASLSSHLFLSLEMPVSKLLQWWDSVPRHALQIASDCTVGAPWKCEGLGVEIVALYTNTGIISFKEFIYL